MSPDPWQAEIRLALVAEKFFSLGYKVSHIAQQEVSQARSEVIISLKSAFLTLSLLCKRRLFIGGFGHAGLLSIMRRPITN